MSKHIDTIVLAHSVTFIASASSKGGINCVHCFAWNCYWPLTHTFFARKFWVGVGALKVLAANKRENICPKFGQVYFREGEFRSE